MSKKETKQCLFIRQLENGQWVRCTRSRDKHTHPESQAGLRKAVTRGLHYQFVQQVKL